MKNLATALLLLTPALVLANDPPALAPANIQIASAVAPLPEGFRESATVLGYTSADSGLVTLRDGSGPFICLAHNPNVTDQFHVACYHRSLEPFMARGRDLRAQGRAAEVNEVRNREIEEGTLPMPAYAPLYSLTGRPDALNPDNGDVIGARPLFVIYVPFADADDTGLPTVPKVGEPWLMDAGTPRAHIMFRPDMP